MAMLSVAVELALGWTRYTNTPAGPCRATQHPCPVPNTQTILQLQHPPRGLTAVLLFSSTRQLALRSQSKTAAGAADNQLLEWGAQLGCTPCAALGVSASSCSPAATPWQEAVGHEAHTVRAAEAPWQGPQATTAAAAADSKQPCSGSANTRTQELGLPVMLCDAHSADSIASALCVAGPSWWRSALAATAAGVAPWVVAAAGMVRRCWL